ncbi:MAG: hypothetical protein ACI4NW_03255, partial [Stenotrophomonas sp.]
MELPGILWITFQPVIAALLSTVFPLLATVLCTKLCDDVRQRNRHHSLSLRISLSQSSRSLPSVSI